VDSHRGRRRQRGDGRGADARARSWKFRIRTVWPAADDGDSPKAGLCPVGPAQRHGGGGGVDDWGLVSYVDEGQVCFSEQGADVVVSVIAPESVIAVTVGNLISNAIRYTPSGEVVCTIGNGRILVEDTGPGIPEKELSLVMNRHYRGEGVSGKGSGLGLAISKRLCELYGWSIHFQNRETGGLRAELRFFSQV